MSPSIVPSIPKLFMVAAVIGIIATFITGKQSILAWSAVSAGLGLALGFFREAFRPRVGFENQSEQEEKRSENDH